MSSTIIELKKSSGDISYEELFKEHSRLIFKLINNFIRSSNIILHNSEVDDIYQEVALKIFKNDYLSKYKSEKSSFITWLNIICRTTTIDYYRKRLHWMESLLSENTPNQIVPPVDAVMFSLPAGVLTDRQAEIITLLYKEGLVPGEIAQRLDITTRTVRSLKFQALGRLRAYYGATRSDNSPAQEEESRRKVS